MSKLGWTGAHFLPDVSSACGRYSKSFISVLKRVKISVLFCNQKKPPENIYIPSATAVAEVGTVGGKGWKRGEVLLQTLASKVSWKNHVRRKSEMNTI